MPSFPDQVTFQAPIAGLCGLWCSQAKALTPSQGSGKVESRLKTMTLWKQRVRLEKSTGWGNDIEVDTMWDIFLDQADGKYLAGFNDGSSLVHKWTSDAMLSIEQMNSFEGVEYARSK